MSQLAVGSSSTEYNSKIIILLLMNVSAMIKVIILIIGSQYFHFYFTS